MVECFMMFGLKPGTTLIPKKNIQHLHHVTKFSRAEDIQQTQTTTKNVQSPTHQQRIPKNKTATPR